MSEKEHSQYRESDINWSVVSMTEENYVNRTHDIMLIGLMWLQDRNLCQIGLSSQKRGSEGRIDWLM